jgi:hypothetical protein
MLVLGGLACDRKSPTAPPLPEASATPAPAQSSVREPLALSESEAIARVVALPEYKDTSSQEIEEAGKTRRKVPVARVLSRPELVNTSNGADQAYFEIIVADRASFGPDGGLASDEPPELHLRVNAYGGAISVRTEGDEAFREYAAWAAVQRQRQRAAALVMSTPEWKTRAARIRNSNEPDLKPELGLVFGSEPKPGCVPGLPDCRYNFTGIRVCSGCAGGLWTEFEVDPVQETLFVKSEDFTSTLPYGKWRNLQRAQAAKETDEQSRALGNRQLAFPDHRPGLGPFGYGKPERAKPTAVSPAARAALELGGYAVQRVERYPGGFTVYVVEPAKPGVLPETSGLRTWGADLVRANGGHACEVIVLGSTRRFQFDRFALTDNSGGVYVLIDDDFHPWMAPDA